MAITREDVLHVARLARIQLEPGELEGLVADLERIVDYVAELRAVDTTGVPPTAQVSVQRAPLRVDEAGSSLRREQSLSEAPRTAEGAFAVPAFVDES